MVVNALYTNTIVTSRKHALHMNLSIKNLSKTYPNGVQALRDVNLEIPLGMFGLLGPNGAGKSSLMRTIATLQEPDTGNIQLGDLNVFLPLPSYYSLHLA